LCNQDVLLNVKQLRAETSRVAKHFAAEAKLTRNSAEAAEVLQNAKGALQQLYNVESRTSKVDIKKSSNTGILPNVPNTEESHQISDCLVELSTILKSLRKLPIVELNTPSAVLVGSPNVGKSSLVRAISSGVPEVADYAFTTRSVSIGHIETDGHHIQVIDTPGLLDRPASKRNDMESLTFSSMAHIPSVVLFVIDPTGLSGPKSTLNMQLNIRQNMRKQFPIRPWIDVITKSDVECDDEVLSRLPPGAIFVSPKSGSGMNELHALVHDRVAELAVLLKDRAAMQNSPVPLQNK
jgi:nucleolar GTP-binding protein